MPEIYENASSSTISVTIDPAMDYEQLSQFYYDDSKFFQPLNQTPNEVNVLTGELVLMIPLCLRRTSSTLYP